MQGLQHKRNISLPFIINSIIKSTQTKGSVKSYFIFGYNEIYNAKFSKIKSKTLGINFALEMFNSVASYHRSNL